MRVQIFQIVVVCLPGFVQLFGKKQAFMYAIEGLFSSVSGRIPGLS